MEVLVINDCTLDSSRRIADDFSRFDPRVRVIDHDVNLGLGAARNTGLREARGEYVTFPDSDDIIATGAYARMVQTLDRSGSVFATGPAEEFGGKRKRYWTTDSPVFDEDREGVRVASHPELIEDHTAWNKVFRRTFLLESRVEWPIGVKCEDVAPSARAYVAAKSVDVVSEVVYLYRRRPDSITTALGSAAAFSDWITQSLEALRAVDGAPPAVRARLSRKILVREYLVSVRLSAITGASSVVREAMRRLAETGSHNLSSDDLTGVSAADRLRIGLTAGGHFDALARWSDRTARARKDDLELDAALVPEEFRQLLGFGRVGPVDHVDYPDEVPHRESESSDELGDSTPLLSVVIPTHNVVEYLDETIRSVLSSRDVDLEVVIVDDWSTDGTHDIALRHAARDPRVRVYRSSGRGGGQARNLGVELARGRYLAFSDGDDLVPPNAYWKMLRVARTSAAEIVTAKHLRTYAASTWDPTDKLYPLIGTFTDTSVREQPSLIHPRTIWNRVFLRKFWETEVSPFCGAPRANDIVPFTSAILRASRVAYVPIVSYIYRARPGRGSMTAQLGSASSIVSYMSEESTCAELVLASDSPGLISKYWHTVLTEDGFGNLRLYLESQKERSFDDATASSWVNRLLTTAPLDSYRLLSPEQQAVWALVASGNTRSASAMVEATRRPASLALEQTVELVDSLCATRMLASKALDFILWKYLIRRLVDEAKSLTLTDAAAGIHALRSSGRLNAFVTAPGTREDNVVRAARLNAPQDILDLSKPTPHHENVSVRDSGGSVVFSGESVEGALAYQWLFVRGTGRSGRVRRVPIALIRFDRGSVRWSAEVSKDVVRTEGEGEIWCSYEDSTGVHHSKTALVLQSGKVFPRDQPTDGAMSSFRDAQHAFRAGRWDEAISLLADRASAGTSTTNELVLLARAYREVLQYDEAASALKSARAMQPADGNIRSEHRNARIRALYQRSFARVLPLPKNLSKALR